MPTAIALAVGDRFGRLVVVGDSRTDNRTLYEVECDCGNTRHIAARSLRSGNTRSCGCLHREQLSSMSATHRKTETPEYLIWCAAKARCFRPTDKDYKYYGGRGIVMCEEWRNDFAAFLAYVGQRPCGLTLDRIDNDGNYRPGNVRWVDRLQQARNRRKRT